MLRRRLDAELGLDKTGALMYTVNTSVRGEMAENQVQYWTAKELAKAAGVTSARVRQILIEGRKMRGQKAGPVWVVSDREARRWLKARGVEVD